MTEVWRVGGGGGGGGREGPTVDLIGVAVVVHGHVSISPGLQRAPGVAEAGRGGMRNAARRGRGSLEWRVSVPF